MKRIEGGQVFNMTKGDEFAFSAADVLGEVTCGLGWDPSRSAGNMDLDSSVIKVFTNGQIDENHVYFGNLLARLE